MFVEIRKKGKNKKYYLVHSVREGRKVTKITRYLGQNLSKEELNKKKIKAEQYIREQLSYYKEIRDPLKTVLSTQELEQLKNLEKKISFKISHLNEKRWQRFTELFSYNTNAIEGSALTLREVKNVIEGKKRSQKSKADIEEARGVAEAIDYVRNTKPHISLPLLKRLHQIVFKNTKSFAGEFRKKGVEVVIRDRIGNIVHRGAQSTKIESLLKELINWYNKNKKNHPSLLLAAAVHNQFENIHPFQDGNGRVGRLLLNNILLKHNMPPVDIELKHRQEYYAALRAYQNEGNMRPTIDLLIKEYNELKKRLR